MDIDFETLAAEQPTASVADIGKLAEQLADLEAEIASIQQTLDKRKAELDALAQHTIPTAMDAANCLEFKYKDGRKLQVSAVVRASIPKAHEAVAFKWLEEHGHEDLIKTELKLQLGKGEDELADEICKDIKDLFDLDMARKQSVHASTLSSFCREQLEEGVELPAKEFGLFQGRVAKFVK